MKAWEFDLLVDEMISHLVGQMVTDMAAGLYGSPDTIDTSRLDEAARSLVDELDYWYRLERLERRRESQELRSREQNWGRLPPDE